MWLDNGRRYECQWEDDKALDSTEEGSRSIHYRADGTECTIQGDELRSLMRRINEQRMMVSKESTRGNNGGLGTEYVSGSRERATYLDGAGDFDGIVVA